MGELAQNLGLPDGQTGSRRRAAGGRYALPFLNVRQGVRLPAERAQGIVSAIFAARATIVSVGLTASAPGMMDASIT